MKVILIFKIQLAISVRGYTYSKEQDNHLKGNLHMEPNLRGLATLKKKNIQHKRFETWHIDSK